MVRVFVAAVIAASLACGSVSARDRDALKPVPDQHAGVWTIHQDEAGSPYRSMYTLAMPESPKEVTNLLIECDGSFRISVMGSRPFLADDGDVTVMLAGREIRLEAHRLSRDALLIYAADIRKAIVGQDRIGVRLRNRDGSPRDVFFRLTGLWSVNDQLEQSCPVKS